MKTKPFDTDYLEMLASNEPDIYKSIRTGVEIIRSAMNRLAERQAKANAAWHDDPSSEDHADYHAPAIDQFPREVRDKAVIGVVEYHLERINENEQAIQG